jgi:hypothetical protein
MKTCHIIVETLLVSISWWLASCDVGEALAQAQAIAIKELTLPAYKPARVRTDSRGRLYLLLPDDHSIAVFDDHHRLIARVGQIGNGPGELYQPYDMAVTRAGEIAVADRGNDRVVVFDSAYKVKGSISVGAPIAVGLSDDGTLFVSGTYDEQLVRVFSHDLTPMGTLGELVATGATDRNQNAYLNRGKIILGGDDSMYFMFRSLWTPLVRRIGRDGSVLSDIHPGGTELTRILTQNKARFEEIRSAPRRAFVATLSAVAIDPRNGVVWIAPTGPALLAYGPSGEKLGEWPVRGHDGRPYGAKDLWISADGGAYLIPGDLGVFVTSLPLLDVKPQG